jgi:hypothetical protein
MANRLSRDWENPSSARHFECGKMIGTRSANIHQGQRSCAPRQQAGHMSALNHLAEASKKPPAPQGPSTHGQYVFAVAL